MVLTVPFFGCDDVISTDVASATWGGTFLPEESGGKAVMSCPCSGSIFTPRNSAYSMMELPQLDLGPACCDCDAEFALTRLAKQCDGCGVLSCQQCVTCTRSLKSDPACGPYISKVVLCKRCANPFDHLPEEILLQVVFKCMHMHRLHC